MWSLIAVVSALRLAGAASIPQGVKPRYWQQTSAADACTTLNQAIQNNPQGNPIPGQLAQDCLSDLPFESDTARQFLAELRKYIQFQSTLEALVAPPKTYLSSATDILGGLDKIAKKSYTSQYQFDLDLQSLISSANDGHFYAWPCSTSIFSFGRDASYQMVSVSVDGRAVPQPYMSTDAALIGSNTAEISAVTTINGQKAADYLNNAASHITSQDPDARWNSLFPSLALLAGGASQVAALGTFTSPGVWPGSNSTLVGFANGTTLSIDTLTKAPRRGVSTTAEGVFEQYCLPASKTSKRATRTNGGKLKRPYEEEDEEEAVDGSSGGAENDAPQATPSPSSPAQYPPTVVRDQYNQMNGFYLDDQTAVMFIPSFSSEGQPDGSSATFANVATKLVSDAVKSGRKRLIIDVSGNGGGDIIRAFDLFRLFFPTDLPYSATRFRRSDATNAMAAIFGSVDPQDNAAVYPLAWRGQVEPDQKTRFGSLNDFLNADGAAQLGTSVSALYANRDYADTSTADDPIRGYGPVAQSPTTPPYSPNDILIVGDGVCASTCTTFVNLMTNVGGVRTVAFGGRPGPGPMQIMGGVRGAQSLEFDNIYTSVNLSNALLAAQPNLLSPAQTAAWQAAQPLALDAFPLRLYGGGVNFRNAYQQGDDATPLQFQYQAADCRLFYTYADYLHPATTWQAASDAVWGGKGCVEGSTGAPGSRAYAAAHPSSTGSGGSGGDGKKKNGATTGRQHAHGSLGAMMLISAVAWLL
ncbi:Interphotoreceptor retinol-binding [Apiospora marii]|uniref:Interphotoreceptor retinol-binding n=1 Tax=Apiospora marii TaxID=335849 RepID=A0ABR1SB58_9PEZI